MTKEAEATSKTLFIKRTKMARWEIGDFVVVLSPSNMKELGVEKFGYVEIENTSKKIKMVAPVTEKRDDAGLSDIDDQTIGLNETYISALKINDKDKIRVTYVDKSQNVGSRMLSKLHYQKAIVRVHKNPAYRETKDRVACVCEEMAIQIGASYGDIIAVESKNKSINARCAKLTPLMQEFHDSIIPESREMWKRDSPIFADADKPWDIHPIFLDLRSRNELDVDENDPVRIVRRARWDVLKRIASFGNISLLGASFTVPFLITEPSASLWAITLMLVGFTAWSVLSTSHFTGGMSKN